MRGTRRRPRCYVCARGCDDADRWRCHDARPGGGHARHAGRGGWRSADALSHSWGTGRGQRRPAGGHDQPGGSGGTRGRDRTRRDEPGPRHRHRGHAAGRDRGHDARPDGAPDPHRGGQPRGGHRERQRPDPRVPQPARGCPGASRRRNRAGAGPQPRTGPRWPGTVCVADPADAAAYRAATGPPRTPACAAGGAGFLAAELLGGGGIDATGAGHVSFALLGALGLLTSPLWPWPRR